MFTVEDSKEYDATPFLDTIVRPEPDNSLSITVYRKPNHTDQYLQWDSHTTIYEPSIVLSIPLPTGTEQCARSHSFSRRQWTTSEVHPVIASTPSGPWTGLKEGSQAMTMKGEQGEQTG